MEKIKKFYEMFKEEESTPKSEPEKTDESINTKIEDIDIDLMGIGMPSGRKAFSGTNRRKQYFYDYYTGRRQSGTPQYELNSKIFKMAKQNDDIGLLAQFCLQIEREMISHDYDLAGMMKKK